MLRALRQRDDLQLAAQLAEASEAVRQSLATSTPHKLTAARERLASTRERRAEIAERLSKITAELGANRPGRSGYSPDEIALMEELKKFDKWELEHARAA